MSNNNGVPAFPGMHQDNHSGTWLWDTGMTLRDYFASKALSGILIATASIYDINDNPSFGAKFPNEAAIQAYQYADAMLAERDKTSAKEPSTKSRIGEGE